MELGMDAIRRRISIRTYNGRPLEPSEAARLRAFFPEAIPGPFGGRPRFVLLEGAKAKAGLGRLGTYGQIRNAPAFIVGAIERAPHALEDFAYALEGIILRATELGLGSCWLGGLFGRSAISRTLGAAETELIPACSPVGHPAERVGLQDKAIRLGAGSRKRKDPSDLFFEDRGYGAWVPLRLEDPLAELFEAVRIGPSASNKQPWRIRFDRAGNRLHLFLQEDRIFNSAMGEIKLQNLDMGIAMRHIEVASRYLGLSGSWLGTEGELRSRPAGYRYISTWILDR
jgi:nitroreductase